MGMVVGVMGSDCTNGGISSGRDSVCAVNVEGPFDPGGAAGPAVMLVNGPTGIPILVPAVAADDGVGWERMEMPDRCGPMAGGMYATTSDSRWNNAVRNMVFDFMAERELLSAKVLEYHRPNDPHRGYAIPCPAAVSIHDRFETWEQYEMMSR